MPTASATLSNILGSQRTPTSDIIVGVAMVVLATACAAAYAVILTTIWRDKELLRITSYKLIFALGVCDVVQCLPHFVTGFFTIFQTTGGYWLAKFMGVLATPFYVGYATLTVILAVQRFIQLASPKLEMVVFSPKSTLVWIAGAITAVILYVIALASPWASIVYIPKDYSWSYDYDLPASYFVQKVEMVIEVGGIFISFFLYAGVIFMLIRMRKRFSSTRNHTAETKILIHALVITVYCSILNIFFHNSQYILPDSLWSYCALNFMWICNSGVNPIMYFIVNSAIRSRTISNASTITHARLNKEYTTTN